MLLVYMKFDLASKIIAEYFKDLRNENNPDNKNR